QLIGLSINCPYNATINLTVNAISTETNSQAASTADTLSVTVAGPAITVFGVPPIGPQGLHIPLRASADEPGETLSYAWTITGPTGSTPTAATPSTSFVPPDLGLYHVSLAVTDSQGRSSIRSATVDARDFTPPAITLTGRTSANANGWNNGD